MLLQLLAGCLGMARLVDAQLPSSAPHNYPGMPDQPFGPAWQKYFRVTDPLPLAPNVASRSFAGNLPVDRPGHPNNTLFFWAFEREAGSLTSTAGERSEEPFIIWLNGGPGSSSLIGLMTENGPLRMTENLAIVENNFSWHKLADTFWVDQPVGAGYSTADATGYVADEDQTGQDFVFPSLASRPMYLTGESYAGTFIPYITKAIFSAPKSPVNLRKIAIGDGTLGSLAVFEQLPTLSVLETYPQIINYDPDVFNYFKDQLHLCGYDLNLTYPSTSTLPTLKDPFDTIRSEQSGVLLEQRRRYKAVLKSFLQTLNSAEEETVRRRHEMLSEAAARRSSPHARRASNLPPLGVLNSTYGCFLWNEMVDYALRHSFPWTLGQFDPYDIPDALNPEAPSDPSFFLNDNRTRSALHAPLKTWDFIINYPFGNSLAWVTSKQPGKNEFGDPSLEPAVFLSELAANASTRGVGIVIYSGNDDSLVAHRGTEVSIQNITFGGIQGFSRKPSTPWYDDHSNFAGIVHQERNLTYVLFKSAGHFVPRSVPEAAFVFLREFVLGSNATGSVNGEQVVGGEDPNLAEDIMPGNSYIFYGAVSTASSTAAPAATVAAWNSFIATATLTSPTSAQTHDGNEPSSGQRLGIPVTLVLVVIGCVWFQ